MHRFIKSKYFIWVVVILGLVLRLISLNQSIWLDEATTALAAKMPLTDIFTKFLPADFHPPFYYLLMKGWVGIFGSSEIALRIPSVIFGVATIYFIYLIAKKFFDRKVAVIASALAASSGLLIYYSQEARMYSLAAFLVSILFYLFLERKWIPFSICLAILGMTDYTALLVVPVFIIFAGKDLKKVLLSTVPLIGVFALWTPTFLEQIGSGVAVTGTNWGRILGVLSWKNLGLIPVKFILGRISFDNKLIYAFVAGGTTLFYLALLGLSILRRPCKDRPCKVVWGWLVIPILLGITISIKIPVLHYFRFIFCLPALYILAAKGISGLRGVKFGAVLAVAVVINVLSSGYYLLNPRFQRENWRGITGAVGSDPIVFPSSSQYEALIYYGKGDRIVYYKNFDVGSQNIWLSRYVWNVFDPADSARVKIENLGYNKVQELNLNGVEFWKYAK